jgi:DNA mismatch repair protein MutL
LLFLIDVIKLLPDNVANQIAAGEVVQRPASAVKEMLENCLDAHATSIKLFIKDGGSTYIKIQDNGIGMSETDARMCWERHATSKISTAQDLYSLNTFGFRGEALASIAAVAMVEMVTRRQEDDAATKIIIHGNEIQSQELCSGAVGTTITVKNLFYNIPARRNFLKSISVETKHIIEEFQRQSLANPEVEYELYNNNNEVHKLRITNFKERLRDVLIGYQPQDLLSVNEITEIVEITGHVAVPSKAKRTRGNQFFYANHRFIKSHYLHHAVMAAYEGLIENGTFPTYCLFIKVNPAKIDVNIHPTKTDVKFEDEKHIYSILKAAVRKAVGNFVVQPDMSLGDLDGLEGLLNTPNYRDQPLLDKNAGVPNSDRKFNPFNGNYNNHKRHQDWAKILGSVETTHSTPSHYNADTQDLNELIPHEIPEVSSCFQLKNGYICAVIAGDLHVINTHRAHKRILFEKYLRYLAHGKGVSQQLLFPRNIELSHGLMAVFNDTQPLLKKIGFELSQFGGNSILVNGLPPDLENKDELEIIENILTDIANGQDAASANLNKFVATSMASNAAMKNNTQLEELSQKAFVNELLRCTEANYSPDGLPAIARLGDDVLFEMFKKGKI